MLLSQKPYGMLSYKNTHTEIVIHFTIVAKSDSDLWSIW